MKTTLLGRVLLEPTDRGFALVVGPSRVVVHQEVSPDSRPGAGDLVEVEGDREGHGAIVASRVTVVREYTGPRPFPPPHSDWYRFHRNGARILHALEQRALLLHGLRTWFDERGFLEVDTPAIATSPGLEVHLEAVAVDLRPGFEASSERRYLVTSPEYFMKRLLSAGMSRIYQIGKAFRSGEAGAHHNPEFTMLEWYRAPSGWEAIVRDTEELVVAAASALGLGPEVPFGGHLLDLRPPWPRLTVRDAIRRYAGYDPAPWDDVASLRARAVSAGIEGIAAETDPAEILVRTLVERVEPSLPHDRPVVLCNYPNIMASLARRSDHDPTVSERFEIYLGGVELANGFGELTDPVEQRARFEADLHDRRRLGLPEYPIDERFLESLSVGCPPAGGIALGVDRLLMILTGAAEISEVIPFPVDHA